MKLTFDVPDEYAVGIRQVMNEVLAGLKEPEFPQVGDIYYYITSVGNILIGCYDDHKTDNAKLDLGNCFKTIEDAKFKVEQLKVLHELEQLADDDKPWDGITIHWYPVCSYCNTWRIETVNSQWFRGDRVHFKSKESCQAAIDKIGENRLKKYYFCIPEDKT